MLVNALLADWKARLAPSTVYHRRQVLKRMLKALEQFGAPPIAALLPKVKRPEARPNIASPTDLAALLRTAPTWQKLFILLCWQMALRHSEALRVSPRSFNAEHHTITIRTKGGHVRTIPTTQDVETLLAAAGDTTGREDESYILILKGSSHLSVHGMRCSWWRLCKNAGITNLHPHDLRRTVLTALYAATKDLRAAQQFAGHQNLASTCAYFAPLTEEQLRDYHRLLNFHSDLKQ